MSQETNKIIHSSISVYPTKVRIIKSVLWDNEYDLLLDNISDGESKIVPESLGEVTEFTKELCEDVNKDIDVKRYYEQFLLTVHDVISYDGENVLLAIPSHDGKSKTTYWNINEVEFLTTEIKGVMN